MEKWCVTRKFSNAENRDNSNLNALWRKKLSYLRFLFNFFSFLRYFSGEKRKKAQSISLIFIVIMFLNHFVFFFSLHIFIPICCCSSLQLRFSHNTFLLEFPSKSFSFTFLCFFSVGHFNTSGLLLNNPLEHLTLFCFFSFLQPTASLLTSHILLFFQSFAFFISPIFFLSLIPLCLILFLSLCCFSYDVRHFNWKISLLFLAHLHVQCVFIICSIFW